LDVLMGAAPGTYAAEIVAAPGAFRLPAVDTTGGPAQLLRRRPDVIAAERKVAASNAMVGAAIAEYYPSFSLSSVLGFSSLESGKLFTSDAFQPAAALGLHWRLFDFGRVDAEVKQAKGANREALLDYRSSMLRATEDVENAIVALNELARQQALLEAEVQAHGQARDAAQEAYRGGAVSLLEVLDEDRQLRRHAVAQVEHHFVDVAPSPALRRIVAFDDRVPGLVEVFRRVTVGRIIATTDMAASAADAQVNPLAAGFQALLASAGAGSDILDGVQVHAVDGHGDWPLGGVRVITLTPKPSS
jgi:hypothetical protein